MAIVFVPRKQSHTHCLELRSTKSALHGTFAASLVAVLLVAGCSGGAPHRASTRTPNSSRPAGPDHAMITWVGEVCAADAHVQEMAGIDIPVTSDPPRSQVLKFVETIHKELQVGVATFQAIGHAPVTGGDHVVASYIRMLKDIIPDIRQVESNTRSHSPMMDNGNNLPLLEVSVLIESPAPKGPDLPSLIDRNPALARAYRAAEPCQPPFNPLKAESS